MQPKTLPRSPKKTINLQSIQFWIHCKHFPSAETRPPSISECCNQLIAINWLQSIACNQLQAIASNCNQLIAINCNQLITINCNQLIAINCNQLIAINCNRFQSVETRSALISECWNALSTAFQSVETRFASISDCWNALSIDFRVLKHALYRFQSVETLSKPSGFRGLL